MRHLCLTLIFLLGALGGSAAATMRCWHFEGKMGGDVKVEIFLKNDARYPEVVAGYIFYPAAPSPAPILLAGIMDGDWMYIDEYLPDGLISGTLSLRLAPDGGKKRGAAPIAEGTWSDPKGERSYSLTSLRLKGSGVQAKRPAWWPGSPLQAPAFDDIPGDYAYSVWNPEYQSLRGGTAEFIYGGEDRVYFNISNGWHNEAQGSSHNHCPAVLYDNEFEYDDINECGYGIKAIFFEKFVVVRNTTDVSTLDCFGPGTSLAAIYIKQPSR